MPKAKPAAKKKSASALSPFQQSFLLGVLLICLVVGALGYWSHQRFVVQEEQNRIDQIAQTYAQQQAALVANYLRNLRQNIHRFTERESLATALAQNDEAELNRFQSVLRSAFSDARGIQIFPNGSAQLNADADPPIRFSELDMINRAEKRQQVFPEATRVADEWRINLVQALPPAEATDGDDPAPVMATLFMSLPVADLRRSLANTDLSQGKSVLMQQFERGEAQVVLSVGEGDGLRSQDAKIPTSYWSVRFTPSAVFAAQGQVSALPLFGALALLALVLLGINYFVARRFADRRAHFGQAAMEQVAAGEGGNTSTNVLDIQVKEEDAGLLGLIETDSDPLDIREAVVEEITEDVVPATIFRAYDIRGTVPDQLRPELVINIGRAIGSEVLAAGDKAVVVGRDGRTHSPDVAEQLIEGILSTGCNVINIGMVPTPLVYFATHELGTTTSGVAVTASHNPADYNGFKVVIKGHTLLEDDIQQLRLRILQENFAKGSGTEDFTDLSMPYIDRIFSDLALAGELTVVVDCGNGVAGDLAPRLFSELGCKVVPLFCTVDGRFPNHDPDPSIEKNLQALIAKVKETKADLGIALDGDGDRVGIVSASGQIIWPDRLLMLMAKDIVARNPGADVLFDVKSSRELNTVITAYGGRPIMWKSGHSHMKAKMQETNALLGGELSGHIFIKERWYGFDDGLYVAARLMEIMSLREQDLDSIFESFPNLPATPEIKISASETKKFELIKKLTENGDFGSGKISTLDGLRVDYPEGWGLVRASNTSPALTLRFEGQSADAVAQIQARFKKQLLAIEPSLSIPF